MALDKGTGARVRARLVQDQKPKRKVKVRVVTDAHDRQPTRATPVSTPRPPKRGAGVSVSPGRRVPDVMTPRPTAIEDIRRAEIARAAVTGARHSRPIPRLDAKVSPLGLPSDPEFWKSSGLRKGVAEVLGNAGHEAVAIGKGFVPATAQMAKAIGTDVATLPSRAMARQIKSASDVAPETQTKVVDPMVADYRYRYGPLFHGDVSTFGERAKERPLSLALDLLTAAQVGASGAKLALGQPIRIPEEARTLPLGTGRRKAQVQMSSSPNPFARTVGDLLDKASIRFDRTPVVGSVIGSTKRAGRQAARELRRGYTRNLAGGAGDVRKIQRLSFTKVGRGKDDLRTALYWDSQLPEHARGVEGLQAIRDDLAAELERPLPMVQLPESPALQRQRGRTAGAEKLYAGAREKALGPIVSKRRDEYASALREQGLEEHEVTAAVDLADAWAHYVGRERGVSPAKAYSMVLGGVKRGEELPEGALKQIADFDYRVDPREASRNLRSKLNPRNQAKGLPVNPTIRRKGIVVAGKVTPKSWLKRVEHVMPGKAERDRWARWYENFEPLFREAFGEDADAMMRGFAVSQANASPTFGLEATMKVLDKVKRGEEVKPNEISVVVKGIEAAVKGEHISKGMAAKLRDFADSLAGKATRTHMGDDPRGGAPAAVDVHALRDLGYIDPKLINRLKSRHGLEINRDFVVDSSGVAKGPLYERAAEQYAAISKHLNRVHFDGRSDWTPAQVQALGWATVQKLHGVDPEDLPLAIDRNTRTVNLEVTKGIHGIGEDLSIDEAKDVGRQLEPSLRKLAEANGLKVRGVRHGVSADFRHGVSGYESSTNASVHFDLLGSREQVQRFVDSTARAFDQWEVWATRRGVTGAGSKATLEITSPAFADEAKVLAFWERLREEAPDLAGFAPIFGDKPGLSIITSRGSLGPKEAQGFRDRYAAAVQKAADDTLGDAEVDYTSTNTEVKRGVNDGEGDGQGPQGDAGRGLAGDAEAEARGELERSVEAVRARRRVQQRALEARGDDLAGLPGAVEVPGLGKVQFHSNARAQQLAREYVDSTGLPYDPPRTYAKVDPERAARIAKEYDEALDDPAKPEVAASYDAFAKETLAQYQLLEREGIRFEFMPEKDPYELSPRYAMIDLLENDHMYVYPTEAGFGSEGGVVGAPHPLLADSGVRWGGRPVTFNDLFRAVHDYFGHFKEGVGFRADGEENAWRSHSAMYSDAAKPSMTAETRGQNSWVNYGPYGERNRTARTEDTVFAEQKATTLPDWVQREGAGDEGILRQAEKGAYDPATKTIHLFETADVSTAVHEFYHAAQPFMAKRHREVLDRTFKGDLEAETRAFEAYLREGKAPSAALERAFRSLRDLLRRIYSSAARLGRVPAEARQAWDEMLSVSGEQYGPTVQRFGAAASREKDKLQSLERRHAHREAMRTLSGKQARLEELEKELNRLDPDSERAAALDDRIAALEQEIAAQEQLVELTSERREKQIQQRLGELDRAIEARKRIEKDPKARDRYEQAMTAASKLTQETEAIKREVFGDELGDMFEERRALLGEHVLGDEVPSDVYMRHTPKLEGIKERVVGRPSSNTFGKVDTKGLLGGGENELMLYRYGALNPDPDVVVESWMRAQSFKYLLEVRDLLAQAGEPIPIGGRPKPGWYISNPKGKVLPRWWKEIEAGDDETFLTSLQSFGSQILGKSDDMRSIENFVDPETGSFYEGVVQIDPEIVNAMFGRFGGPGRAANPVGTSADIIGQLVKTSLLYLNPGYIPANLTGNLVFLGVQQPVMAIPNLLRSAKTIWGDRELADLIEAEVGHGPTMSVAAELKPGQGRVSRAVLSSTRTIAHRVGAVADNWPRMAAWVYEARRAGFKSREAQMRLLKGDTPQLEQKRLEVGSRANEAMVNFDRLGPDEKAVLGRVFFVWPWIRGATAWAGRFAIDSPAKGALLQAQAQQSAANNEDVLGNLKGYLENVVPTGPVHNGVVPVFNAGPISPLATAVETAETASGVAGSIVNGEGPPPKYRRLIDLVNPVFDTLMNIARSENSFGREVSMREALADEARGLAPAADLALDLKDPQGGVYPEDATRLGRLKRAARVLPYDLDLTKAREKAVVADRPKADEEEWVSKMTKKFGPLPDEVVEARQSKTAYQASYAALKDELGAKKLTDKQKVALMVAVYANQKGTDQQAVESLKDSLPEAGKEEVAAMSTWLKRELGWTTTLRWFDSHVNDGAAK